MSEGDLQALGVTLKLAASTTLALLLLGTPLAWWLARTRSKAAAWVDALVALPLVLPPTVLGFYLLVLLGPQGAVGQALAAINLPPLVFSFGGLLVASIISSMPFMVQPLRDAFLAVSPRLLDAAATLRASPLDAFFSVAVPLARRGFLSAITLTFAHTVGEFGVVLMVGGNIPGVTRVVSVQIFDHVEALEYADAHRLAAVMLVFAFVVLLALQAYNARQAKAVRA